MFELFDTHAHLQEAEFRKDLDAVVERARLAGVTDILLPAVDLESAEAALALAERYPEFHVAAGYHPHEAAKLDEAAFERLDALMSDPKVVAVGEIGLDFYRMHSPADVQVRVFESMLHLALEHCLPVVVHCRDAAEATEEILTAWAKSAEARIEPRLGVLHYFSQDVEAAERYVNLGFTISVHTSVTHPKAEQLRDVVKSMPLGDFVIETDSPYGAPQAFRGKRNEPAYVIEAARTIAELKDWPLDVIADTTTFTARYTFHLNSPLASPGGTEA